MNDAIPVTMELIAVRVRRLGVAAALRSLHREREAGKRQARGRLHFRSLRAWIAALLTSLRWLPRNDSDSSNFRARAGSVAATRCARAIVAASFETSVVGWSISGWISFSPS